MHPDARRPAPGLAGEGASSPEPQCRASQGLVQDSRSTGLEGDSGLSIQHVWSMQAYLVLIVHWVQTHCLVTGQGCLSACCPEVQDWAVLQRLL